MAQVTERTGGIDILVNNVAVFDVAPIVEITRDSFKRLYAINVAGVRFTLQAAAKAMSARGKGGKIINIASQAGRRGERLVAVYCATKAAMISTAQSAVSVSSSTAPLLTPSPPQSSMASTETVATRCSSYTRSARSARRSGRSTKPFPLAGWARPRI